jgi:hypothetical protein
VSSNMAPAPGLVCFQDRDAIGQHHHQQPSAAVVLGPVLQCHSSYSTLAAMVA